MTTELSPEQATRNKIRWANRRRVAVNRGLYPARTVIRGGRILDVFTEELYAAEIALDGPWIVGIGSFPDAQNEILLDGEIIVPSFIDSHIHTESSLLWMPEFAAAVVPHGTGAIVTDPHEMANVCGLAGVAAMRDAARNVPMMVRFTAPSCVPASAHEHPGAVFGADEIREMLGWDETLGLGEMMNYAGLLDGDPVVGEIIALADGVRRDGHAPMLRGADLQAYASVGMESDHESTSAAEALEKLRAGMMIMIREGSSEKNLRELLPIVNDATWPRICFASDDRDCHDLLHAGHVDDILRLAIQGGIAPARAIRMATWNAAQYWKLDRVGAVAPGYRANLAFLRDLASVNVRATMYDGQLVAKDGVMLSMREPAAIPEKLLQTVNLAPVRRSAMRLAPEDAAKAIALVPGQIVTKLIRVEPTVADGAAVSDPSRDLIKTVAIERHHATGQTGVGLVRGFGFQRGAIAATIAHDAHNIVAAGVGDDDILAAIALIAESQGGMAVVADGEILAHLPLPIAGLMSPMPLADVAAAYQELTAAARSLGSETAADPFGQLTFLSLSVIPEARILDTGLLDLSGAATG